MTRFWKLFTNFLKVLNLQSVDNLSHGNIWPYNTFVLFLIATLPKKLKVVQNNLKATKKICFNFENCVNLISVTQIESLD